MMDLHGGDSLLNDCLTLVRCWLGILPLGIGVLLTVWWMPFIVATWRVHLLGECPTWEEVALCILEEGIRP
jgi:hypothetical protein